MKKNSLNNLFLQEIEKAKSEDRFRELSISERKSPAKIFRDNKEYISFSCNDYLGLANDKRLILASKKATDEYGTGAGASRLITGNNKLYKDLEDNISKLNSTDETLVFSSGYLTNLGIISAIFGKNDLLVIDKLSHSCIIEGSFLSGAEVKRFHHNNYKNLEQILEKNRKNFKNCGIITEAVFSMDGDRADLEKINKIAKKYDSFVIADFAHDINFSAQKYSIKNENFIKIGTLSKAFAGLGGYASGVKNIKSFLVNKCKPLIFSTALPPSVLASNNKAVEIVLSNKNIGKFALENAKYFYGLMKKKNSDFIIKEPESQIIPIIIGDSKKAVSMSKKLAENGFLVHAIRPPTIPKNTARLRFSFSNSHTKEQIENLVEAINL
ncbi:MAG: aminotransferase class I/II-fold pyridoxal phosphate-dependent enzyme [Rickettsiales bacterium]|nr:aminotransferase class I/II-fold pyridoxal phosphate-dependent enzyme [Rickettsiales bacterium]